jgi:hypothetical protein
MYHIVETRAPNFFTNSIHIHDEEGRSFVTVWEVHGRGQDELWDRAQGILDYLNDYDKIEK